MTDIEYAQTELMKRLDDLAIPDMLRTKLLFYIYKTMDDENKLDEILLILDENKERINGENKGLPRTYKKV